MYPYSAQFKQRLSVVIVPSFFFSVINTWCDVAVRAGDGVGGSTEIPILDELGQSEVGDVRLEIVADEDVVGLDVSVDDRRHAIVVEIGQPVSRAHRDLVPRFPFQRAAVFVEQASEASVGHVVVHQQPRVFVPATPQEPHDVLVPDRAQGLDLRRNFSLQ